MTFSSLIFLTAFFPITLLGYWLFSKSRKLEIRWASAGVFFIFRDILRRKEVA